MSSRDSVGEHLHSAAASSFSRFTCKFIPDHTPSTAASLGEPPEGFAKFGQDQVPDASHTVHRSNEEAASEILGALDLDTTSLPEATTSTALPVEPAALPVEPLSSHAAVMQNNSLPSQPSEDHGFPSHIRNSDLARGVLHNPNREQKDMR
ncbi:hypothetical protein B0H14DRAFT_2743195 [Mycena olivaceomarginata]|nr:hypothetical protein B0H14DRAFT_2743195 [Mycena olivaceomarginata]